MAEPSTARAGRRARRAFTLIELLVVMAMIAILASLLAPSLGAARARAHEAVCRSNLHQVGLAVQSYMADWDGKRPFGFADLADNWLTDPRVLVCAADPLAGSTGWGEALWRLYQPERLWNQGTVSYLYSYLPKRAHWEYIVRHPDMGYVVCVVHGDAMGPGTATPPVFQGRLLRLRPDASIKQVELRWTPRESLNTWRLFTGEDSFDPLRVLGG